MLCKFQLKSGKIPFQSESTCSYREWDWKNHFTKETGWDTQLLKGQNMCLVLHTVHPPRPWHILYKIIEELLWNLTKALQTLLGSLKTLLWVGLLFSHLPVLPSKPPTAYRRSLSTAAPKVLLLSCMLAMDVHWSFTPSYTSTVRTLKDPLKPPTA